MASNLIVDEDNPNFVNPRDPNSMVQATFYDYKPLDKFKTESPDGGGEKHYKEEKPFIRIEVPGKPESIIERYATESDKRKWPQQWLYYEMQTGKAPQSGNIPGWKIEEWPEIGEEQVRDLKFRRFYTVEQIAGASDTQAQGMGMGGPSLRIRAQEAIRLRNRQEANSLLAERDEKIGKLESTLESMQSMMAQLMAAQGIKPEAPKMDANGSGPAREKLGLPKREGAHA